MNKAEAKVPDTQRDWQAIEIFLFSNGQESSPPRKYHLRADELDWWDATLNQLARLHYGIQHPGIYLYTTDGRPVEGPLELRDGVAYVAVEPQEDFIEAGYEKYLIKASKSWEKRQARKKKPACEDDRLCCNCTEKGACKCNSEQCGLCAQKEDAVTELNNERFKSPITGAVETLPNDYKSKPGEDGTMPTEYENKLAEYEHKLPENKPELTEYRPKLVGYVPSLVYEPKNETGGISNKHRLDEHESKPKKRYGDHFSNYAVEPAEREVNSNKNDTKISETDDSSGEQKPRHDEYMARPNKTAPRLDQPRPDDQLSNEYRARSDEFVPGKGEPLLNAGEGSPALSNGWRRNELSNVDNNQTSFNEIIATEDELESRSTKLEPKLDSHGYSLSEKENTADQDKARVGKNNQSMDEQEFKPNEYRSRPGEIGTLRLENEPKPEHESRSDKNGTRTDGNGIRSGDHKPRLNKYNVEPDSSDIKNIEHIANPGTYANEPRDQTGKNVEESRSSEDLTDPHDLLLNRQESRVYRENESIHPYRESDNVRQGKKGENRSNGVEYRNIVGENLGRGGELRGKENDHTAKTSEDGRKDINPEKKGAKPIVQRKEEAGLSGNSNRRAEDFVSNEGDIVTEPKGMDTAHGVRSDDFGVIAENIGKNQPEYKLRLTEKSDKDPDRVARVVDLGDKAGNTVTNLNGGVLGRNTADRKVRAFEQRNRATLLRGDDQGIRTNDYGPRVVNHGPRVNDLGGKANRHKEKEEKNMSRAGDLKGRVIENKTRVGDPETRDSIVRRIVDESGVGVSSGARNSETGARVSIGARGGEFGPKFNPRSRTGETGNRASSGGRGGENVARGRTGESGIRASSGGRDGNTGPRVSIGVRSGETGARVSAGGKAGDTGNRASSGRNGGETGAKASLLGKIGENGTRVSAGCKADETGNRVRSGNRGGETGIKTSLGARGGETRTRINSGERGVETGIKTREPKPKLSSGDRNSESGARTSPGARPGMPNATAEPVSGLGEPEPRDINGATGFVRRSNLSGEKPSSRKPTPPLPPSIPPTITEGKKLIKSNRENLVKKITEKTPIRSLNASAPFSEPKVEPKYPLKSLTPPAAPPPTGSVNQTIIQRKSNSLTKIMSNHRNLATDNAPVENIIGDKEKNNVVSTNIYRNFESEVQSMRLDSGERRIDETQIEQTIVQQQSKCSHECIADNEDVQTVTKHDPIGVGDKDALEIITNSTIELTRTSSRQRDNTAATDNPEEKYISIINKGDVVNLKLNIEVRNAGRSGDCSQNDQRSRSFTNVIRIEKESQISFNDDMYMQSKSLQSLLNNECFKGSGFEGCPKVVVIKCPCCAHKLNNHQGYDATCKDSKKYVVFMANSQPEDSDDKCCCEPTCHVYGQNVNPQSRKTSIYNPVKKTFSDTSLETLTMWESCVCQSHDIHVMTTNSTVQIDAERSETSSNKRKVIITADCHMDYKKSTSQIFGSQTQFIITNNSNCVQACQGKCSQVEPQVSTQADSQTCLPGCPVIQLRDCLKACSRACPKVLSHGDPLAILQVQSQDDLQACPRIQSQGSFQVCPHDQTQEGSHCCPHVQLQEGSQACPHIQSQGSSRCCPQVQSQGSTHVCPHVQTQGGSQACSKVQSQEGSQAYSQVQSQGGSHCCPQVQSQGGSRCCPQVQSQGGSRCCPQVQSQGSTHVCPHAQTQGGSQACSKVQSQVQSQGASHCCPQVQSQGSSHVCPHDQTQGGLKACSKVQMQGGSQAYPQVQRQGSSQPCSHVRSHGGSQTYLQVQSQGCSQACAPQTMQIQSQIHLITPTLQAQSQQTLQIQSQVCPQKRSQGCTQIRPEVSDAHTQTEWCNVLLEVRRHENGRYSFHLPPLHVLRYYTN